LTPHSLRGIIFYRVNETRLEKLRDQIYRRTRPRRVRTLQDAARFIDDVGFCLLFASTQNIELPSLFEAVKGRRDVHIEDWDADSDRLWVWKNDLPAAKRAYYGKALASGKPVFISLKMLPYLYAMRAPRDVNEEYRHGRTSLQAKRVYDVLRERGPTPAIELKRAAGFERKDGTRRFHQGLDELQRAMVVMPVGAVVESGAWASQIFGLTARWFTSEIERSERVDLYEARRQVIAKYIKTVVAAKVATIMRLFSMPRADVGAAADELIAKRILKKNGEWLVLDG
jgi:hypothetical protein